MRTVKFILYLLISLVFIIFCVVNRNVVSLSLYPAPYSFEVPVFVLVLVSIAMGVLITEFSMNLRFVKTKLLHRKTEARMRAVENENKSLRSERELTLPAISKQS